MQATRLRPNCRDEWKVKKLDRLFRPQTVAVVGGGAWCRSVLEQCQKLGFDGSLWPVHPSETDICGIPAFESVRKLPCAPDSAFIGVNRDATVECVRDLSAMGAGGAVCFASGFSEAFGEIKGSTALEAALVSAAEDMPILGPNCYGYINILDRTLLWPDQHGLESVDCGVAIVSQSSNIAINMTMQRRAVPVAFISTVGNQAQIGMEEIGAELLQDPRVTALGMYVEGFGDIRGIETLAASSRALQKPVVVLKTGRSRQSRQAAISHTASLAGSIAGSDALIERLGFAQVFSLSSFLETLKLLHVVGPLPSSRVASVSCSGGEASLVADIGAANGLVFPSLSGSQKRALKSILGTRVALANPLDYHTYIWRDHGVMARTWSAMMDPSLAMTILIVDFPRADRCDPRDWECAVSAAIESRKTTGANVAMIATLPELMPESIAKRLMECGIVPMNGLDESIQAISAASKLQPASGTRASPLLLPSPVQHPVLASESDAKGEIEKHGITVPKFRVANTIAEAKLRAREIGFPVVLKGIGVAHKSEAGMVALGLGSESDLALAAAGMQTDMYLIEEMVMGAVAELLVGVFRDEAHGYVLTMGAGGMLAELIEDRQFLLIPSTEAEVSKALDRLKVSALISGHRGGPSADRDSIISAVLAIQGFAVANHGSLEEVEINPLLCCQDRAVAADALLRRES